MKKTAGRRAGIAVPRSGGIRSGPPFPCLNGNSGGSTATRSRNSASQGSDCVARRTGRTGIWRLSFLLAL